MVQKVKEKIALLIDCDNISFKSIEKIIELLNETGDVIIKRAYGNWRNDNLRNWLNKLTELSIKPIQQIDYTKGKNATDMAIAIDAMRLLYEKQFDSFALVSSDSDFTPLVMALQEEGKKVYGFGYNSSPIALVNACSSFTNLTPFLKDSPIVKETKVVAKKTTRSAAGRATAKKQGSEVRNNISIPTSSELEKIKLKSIDIFIKINPTNEPIILDIFSRALKDNNILYKDLGYKQFKTFLNSLKVFDVKTSNNTNTIKLVKDKLNNLTNKEASNSNEITTTIIALDNEKIKELKSKMCVIYKNISPANEPILLDVINRELKNNNIYFRDYGYKQFKRFLKFFELFDFDIDGSINTIKLKTEVLKEPTIQNEVNSLSV